jgi:hypothetical protein
MIGDHKSCLGRRFFPADGVRATSMYLSIELRMAVNGLIPAPQRRSQS